MKEYGIERSRTHEERKQDALEIVETLEEDESMFILIVKDTEDTIETKSHTTVKNEDMLALIYSMEKHLESLKDKVKEDTLSSLKALIDQLGVDFE